ncbi:MAG: amidohydrolase, partial [Thermoanaerobaculia bacterium]
MRTGARFAWILLSPAAGLFAQAGAKATAPVPRVFSIIGATIHPVSGPDIPNGTLVVRDGKIAAVSAGRSPAADGPVIDATGKHLYPPLFPPMTVLGLEEIAAVRSTLDKSELGEINP